jgi:crotonobetaine/carnitine-CoA ligase
VNKLGALWIPINTDYKGTWLADTLARSRCRVLVSELALYDRLDALDAPPGELPVILKGVQDEAPGDSVPLETLLQTPPLVPDYSGMHYGDSCAVLWTSGTTGRSKGVLQSHNSWIRPIADSASIYYNSQPGDVIYNVLPLYNSAAWMTAVFRGLYEGLPVVVEPQFSVKTFWDRIRHFGATQTFTLGAMHGFLFSAPPQPNDADNPLRVAQMVPMAASMREPFSRRFGVELLPQGFGQSECMAILSPIHDMHTLPENALGHPLPDTEIALLDDELQSVPDGQPGELCIRPLADHVLLNGYFDDDEATENAFAGGWYHTGDLLKRVDGHYYFVDRKRDALRYGGRNISTMEVESVVRAHPAVADVAAFGIPAEDSPGESELALHVVLKARETPTHEDIARFINDNAPHFFVPLYIEFVDALPYTPTQKVQKYQLRERGVTDKTWKRRESEFRVER